MTDLGTVGTDPCSFTNYINAKGQIVGGSQNAACSDFTHAVLWENGEPGVDLNSLIPPGTNLQLTVADWINDRGEIVGLGHDPTCPNGDRCDGHAYVLIPCDENHPDVEGCDYSEVEVTTEAPVSRNTVHLRNYRVFCLAGGQNIAMARTLASLPIGSRVTDYISLGVVSRAVPREKIDSILASTGKASVRQRELPAHLVVYYVIALALYMQSSYREVLRCLLEGIQWLTKPEETVRATGKSGISQARSRLGAEPLRRLYEQVVVPIASEKTRGARYRTWRLISLDGSTLDVADTEENENEFGRPSASRGASAYPQLRFVALLENGTHVLLGGRMGSYATGEITLAKEVVPQLKPGMLCLADRFFFGFKLWTKAQASGCDLLWRVRKHLRLEVHERLSDGSYLSAIYPSEKDGRHKTKA